VIGATAQPEDAIKKIVTTIPISMRRMAGAARLCEHDRRDSGTRS
jgi:hypothetical protein